MALSKITNTGIGTVDDITLSGGVYLGGTGSANKLDDYEVGTWVPTDASGAGLTLTVDQANYVKVGNAVHIQSIIYLPTTADGTTLRIGGLPYTSIGFGSLPLNSNVSGAHVIQVSNAGSNFIIINETNTAFVNSQFSGKFIQFSGTYLTS